MPGKLSLNAQRQGKIVEPGNALEFSIWGITLFLYTSGRCDCDLFFSELMGSNHQITNFESTNISFSTGKLFF